MVDERLECQHPRRQGVSMLILGWCSGKEVSPFIVSQQSRSMASDDMGTLCHTVVSVTPLL